MRSDNSYGSECADFTVNDLGRIRRMVAGACRRVGLPGPTTDDLVLAVNEIVVNAVAYAGGSGSITVAAAPDGVHVTVQDSGPGLPTGTVGHLAAPTSIGGRGLWLARRLSGRLTISSTPYGVTVWLFSPVRIGP